MAARVQPQGGGTRKHFPHAHSAFAGMGAGTGGVGGNKLVTRHLAALDFLLNIPMRNEARIREAGIANANRVSAQEQGGSDADLEQQQQQQAAQLLLQQQFVMDEGLVTSPLDAAGSKKLPGPFAPTVRVPLLFRYTISRISDQGAVVRRWEEQLLSRGAALTSSGSNSQQQPGLLRSRIFFSRARAYPVAICSVIGYDVLKEKAKIEKMRAEDQKGLEVFELPQRDWRGCSYKPLFKTMVEQAQAAGASYMDVLERGYMHDPNFIDNPNLLHAEYRHMMQRAAATGPLISSVILYVNELQLKESLNEDFRERHPQLPPSLTLSKIRNLKKSALLGCFSLSLEVSTCALAVIYFERLVIRGMVTKPNRHLSMAVCLVLAYKFNEPVSSKYLSRLEALLHYVDREWEVTKKEVLDAEFGAFVHLGFSLHAPHQHVYLTYSRLLRLVNKPSRRYLGEEMTERLTSDVWAIEVQKLEFARERERLLLEQAEAEAAAAAEAEQQEREDEEREREEVRAAKAAAKAAKAAARFARARSMRSVKNAETAGFGEGGGELARGDEDCEDEDDEDDDEDDEDDEEEGGGEEAGEGEGNVNGNGDGEGAGAGAGIGDSAAIPAPAPPSSLSLKNLKSLLPGAAFKRSLSGLLGSGRASGTFASTGYSSSLSTKEKEGTKEAEATGSSTITSSAAAAAAAAVSVEGGDMGEDPQGGGSVSRLTESVLTDPKRGERGEEEQGV